MAYSIVIAGDTIYRVDTSGNATALSMPTGVTVDQTRRPRLAVIGRNVVVVNGVTRSVFITPDGTIRPMQLQPPAAPITLSAGAAGGYTGTVNCKMTYGVKDVDSGQLLLESDFSAVSGNVTVGAKLINGVGALACSDNLKGIFRRIYRTTTGPGSTYFKWLDIDNNSITTFADDLSDAGLSLIAAPTELGVGPGMLTGTHMTLIQEWKGRLWAVGDVDIDKVRYSGNGLAYGWPAGYGFDVQPIGADRYGVTAIIRRRDELGFAKRNILWKVIGSSPTNFSLVKVIEGKGCYATDSVCVIRDVAYFLGEDGVYTWGPDGVSSVSDEKVRAWFATDTYFNRAQFPNAVGRYNARYHSYVLMLANAGDTTLNRWVVYDINRKEWFGPHLTTAFTPVYGTSLIDANDLTVPVVGGSDGFVYQENQTTFNDQGAAITMNLVGKSHSCDAPDDTKVFQDLSMLQKVQAGQGALRIGVAVGGYDAAVTKTFTSTTAPATDLRKSRQRFNNLGPGRNCRLEFTEATLNQACELHGYEIPFGVLGRR